MVRPVGRTVVGRGDKVPAGP